MYSSINNITINGARMEERSVNGEQEAILRKPKNVLFVTLVGRGFNLNYGAVLQAYALQKFLRINGYRAKILNYKRADNSIVKKDLNYYYKKLIKILNEEGVKFLLVKLAKKPINFLRVKIEKKLKKEYEEERRKNFLTFKDCFLIFSERRYNSYNEISEGASKVIQEFDIFLVGSDQVWNPFNNRNALKVYLLDFVQNSPRISYASSVSAKIPHDLIDFYRERLSKFDCISVREEESAKEIEKVLGYKPKVNVDPALLLNAEQWEEIAHQPEQKVKKPYIFVYDLYRSPEILPAVQKLARKECMKYINHTPILFGQKLRYPHLELSFYTKGPAEFLWYLKEADFVVTSSFHGVVFSILFRKPFYAILWSEKYKDRMKQNGRITNLLGQIGLIERCFDDPHDILKRGLDKNIDWEKVHEKVSQLREDSIKWLLEALEGGLEDVE